MPPPELTDALNLRVEGYLGGRANQHWLVTAAGERLVLRRYQAGPIGDVGYELTVLRRLAALGWPTPVAVAEPVEAAGRTWCLFQWLPGGPPPEPDARRRGRLLARLHQDLVTLADLGQRPGARRAEDVVADPALTEHLRAYERLYPREARILRWHLDRARDAFAALDRADCPLMVLHGDFHDQNLLYDNGTLTGIIDFEGTHLNHRVSDFALSWRGKYDDVIRGYTEVQPLTELDWALLTPALWAWAFLGVATELRAMASGEIPPHRFEWQTKMLLRRSPLMGAHDEPYIE
ncbi:MAG TPA: phosphotransferase [Pseudonocardiaceae bacterium]|jgi:aminoglycoside phosphotransferase (APT) family kinase protein|nr:phosphotransferase [Pseudonocardiaceae bacterium]